MKKKLLWILGLLVVIMLAVGGYALYVFKFKEYDVADPAVDEVLEDGFEVTLPNGTKVKLDPEGNIISEESPAANDTSTGQPGDSNNTAQEGSTSQAESNDSTAQEGSTSQTDANDNTAQGSNTSQADAKPTVATIKDKYRPMFEDLGGQATSKLNSLIGTAKSEYVAKKSSGESVSVPYFYQKYMSAAQGLEANTDAAFYSLLSIIEADLVKNGFDKSQAQSFVSEYEASKKAREAALLSEIKGSL